jgi:CubicO group peptidase (beta-lactamase class C family)
MKGLLFATAILLCTGARADSFVAEEFVSDYAAKHDFSGTILVAQHGKSSYVKSFGLADIAFKVPNTPATRYKIASITKAFTAVLILQLQEQGRLDTNKTIRTYLPDYGGEGADKVTIHQLLNHTSGLMNFDQVSDAEAAIRDGLPNYQRPHTSDQLVSKFCSGPLVATPGTKFAYNNGDYIVLGKIIERIHGKTFEQVLKERILNPLHMSDTGMLHQSTILPGLANTYFFRDDLKALANDLPVYPENWYASGAMYSTVNDLLAFSNALFDGKLIGRDALAAMSKPGLDDYGYGVWAYDMKFNGKKYKVVKRPGRIMGAQTQLFHVLGPDLTIIVLSNAGAGDLDQFVADLARKIVK